MTIVSSPPRLPALAVVVALLLIAASPASAAGPDLERLTVAQAQQQFQAGSLTSEELTRGYINRIAAVNFRGPSINAVRILNPNALADARALDRERTGGKVRGPMHGIPMIVKDNIDVAGLPTTAGSVALESSFPGADSPVTARLREAGAVILGKANLTEFANFMSSTGMPGGYSSLGGQVLNPYNAAISPSGSSSGSGASAAAGLATVTIGTETSGSIISPAAAQGVVGLRPTVGLISRTGILPISASQDTAGPMTRTVADAAAELQAVAGPDSEDPATAAQPNPLPDYLAALSTDALADARLGVTDSSDPIYQAAVDKVEELGAETVLVTGPASNPSGSILTAEFKRDINAYLGRLPSEAPRDTLADIIAYNDANANEALKFGQGRLIASEAVDLDDPATNTQYIADRDNGRAFARNEIDSKLQQGPGGADDLDAILTPSGTFTGTGARAGYPQLTVPAGYAATTRNPVNVSFNGTLYTEDKLLALGHAYEQATLARRPPSEINPSMWRCAQGSPNPRSCPPGEAADDGPGAPGPGSAPGPVSPAPGPARIRPNAVRPRITRAVQRRGEPNLIRVTIEGRLVGARGRECAGRVKVGIRAGDRRLRTLTTTMKSNCRFTKSSRVRVRRLPPRLRPRSMGVVLKVAYRFQGNAALKTDLSPTAGKRVKR